MKIQNRFIVFSVLLHSFFLLAMEQSQQVEIVSLISAMQKEKPIILISKQSKTTIAYHLVRPQAVQFSKFLQSQLSTEVPLELTPVSQSTGISQTIPTIRVIPIDQKVIAIDLSSNQIACATELINHMHLLLVGDSERFLRYIIQAGEHYDLSYANMIAMLDFFGIEQAFDLFVNQASPECLPQTEEEERAQNQEIVTIFAMAKKTLMPQDTGITGHATSAVADRCIIGSIDNQVSPLWKALSCMFYPGCTKYSEIRNILSFIAQHKNLEKIVLGEYMQQNLALFACRRYTLMGHTKRIFAIEFGIDDTWISTKSNDETIRVWNAERGSLMQMRKTTAKLWSLVAYNKNNTVFAGIASSSRVPLQVTMPLVQTVSVFRTIDKALLCTIACPQGQYVTAMAVNNSGSCIAIGLSNKTMQFFDISRGVIIRTCSEFDSVCTAIDFDDSDSAIVTGTNYGTVQVWDGLTGSFIRTFDSQSGFSCQSITALCCKYDSCIIAIARVNGVIELWNSLTGKQLFSISRDTTLSTAAAEIHSNVMITSLQWSHDGTMLAAGLDSGVCVVFGHTSLFGALAHPAQHTISRDDIYLSLEDEAKPFIMEPIEDTDIVFIPDQDLSSSSKEPLPIDRRVLPAKHARI